MKKYMASHIANYMLDRAEEDGRSVSPMKLLKLVYIAYGWALAVLDRKLFDEPIYAWAHGPVVRSLYDEFKHYKKYPIEGRSIEIDLEDKNVRVITPRITDDDEELRVVLDKVWSVYKHFSAWDLRGLTHEPDTPWGQVEDENSRDVVIPDNLIKEHFRMKIRKYLDNASRAA